MTRLDVVVFLLILLLLFVGTSNPQYERVLHPYIFGVL